MDKVVNSSCKIDLHIHSICSKHKDDSAVDENNLDNLKILVGKLHNNGVNMCALTDHDVFSYDFYKKLKEYENEEGLEKVLPGVEFSVSFEQEQFSDKTIHIIAIFDDSDDIKIKKIENIICNKDVNGYYSPLYDCAHEFSEDKFLDILRKIDLNVILIAHQKSSPKGLKLTKNDVLTVKERCDQLLFTCYFDALEFKNRNNEMFNNSFVFEKQLQDKIGFITGTDCHSWNDYPFMYKGDSENSNDTEVLFTYAKCLPTFKGLMMCFTDYSRLSYENRFFNNCNVALNNLKISLDNKTYDIPLSNGMNVIIGDNSVGKSLFLYELLDMQYKSDLKSDKKKGYEKYVQKHLIKFDGNIEQKQVFQFDSQGEIRNKFENRLFKNDKFLSSFFEDDVNTNAFKTILNNELNKLLATIKKSDGNHKLYNNMQVIDFSISQEGSTTFNVTPSYVSRDSKKAKYKDSLDWLDLLETQLKDREKAYFEDSEWENFDKMLEYIDSLKIKYFQLHKQEILQDQIFNVYKNAIAKFKSDLENAGSKYQQEKSRIDDEIEAVKTNITELFKYKLNKNKYRTNIETKQIIPNINVNNNYNFISSCNITEISNAYFYDVFSNMFKKGKVVDPNETCYDEINFAISNVPENMTGIQYLEKKMKDKFECDLKPKYIINPKSDDSDIHKELSAGMNQRNYFNIISGEIRKKGIYVVDQPEDGVAQKAINEYVLKKFKEMAKNRQVFMITHNPQFIINLDVDNVIFIGKNEKDDTLYVQSGALEYESHEYSILSIVSENIEGGIDALRKRWKRYGKSY
ncbi:MAG: hypothetical protein RSC93_10305 [Erysipelotrichaceae bacterium]